MAPQFKKIFELEPKPPEYLTGTDSTIDFNEHIFRIPAAKPQINRPIIIVGIVLMRVRPAPRQITKFIV